MKTRLVLFLALYILSLLSYPAKAIDSLFQDKVLIIHNADPKYDQKKIFLGSHLYIFKDSTGQLNLEDVRTPEIGKQFYLDTLHELTKWDLDYGSHIKAVWARVTVRSAVTDHLNWLISMSAGEIHFYSPVDSSNYQHMLSGLGVIEKNRQFGKKYGHMSFFPIELAPGQTKTLYFRLRYFSYPMGSTPYAYF
jgi:hypothetical protein